MARQQEDGPPEAKRRRIGIEPLPNNPLEEKLVWREPHDTIQMATWNVAGLETSNDEKWGHAFRMYVEAEDAHVLSITEVKDKDPRKTFERGSDWAFLRSRYPYRYWSNQVAIVSKLKPVADPIYGFPEGQDFDPDEGKERIITLEFKKCFFIATYVPNSGENFKSIDRRRKWNSDFERWIRKLDEKKPVIWSGDFNVVRPYSPTTPRPIDKAPHTWKSPDLQRWANWGKVGGTHADEIKAHERLLGPQPQLSNPRRPGRKFSDVWRTIHKETGEYSKQYTHSSKHLGDWRLDGFIVSEPFLYHVRKCEIRYAWKSVYWGDKAYPVGAASDHWPVWISFELERGDFEEENAIPQKTSK